MNLQGECLGEGGSPYAFASRYGSWMEQDPEDVFAGVIGAVKRAVISARVSPKDIWALSLGGAFHSLLAVDEEAVPLTRALLWGDTRSKKYSLRIREEGDAQQIYRRTGCPVHPMYPASKILWIRENLPEAYRKAHKFISIKEYVLHKLTRRYLVDRSIASGTGLFNIHALDWDSEMLETAGLSADRLSEHAATTTVLEGVDKRYAQAMGIPSHVLVVIGAGDGVLSNLGAGSLEPGQATCTVGASGALRVISPEPKLDQKGRTWCYLVTDKDWCVGGAINNAGLAYNWLRERFYPKAEEGYGALDGEAAQVRAGSDGLVFLPYLMGERSTNWNPDARGVLFGLSLCHDRRHLLRAVMEGVAYRMYSVLPVLEEVAGEIREIRGSGGFLCSPLWVQIIADVFGREIAVPEITQTTSMGAAFLAMYALGLIKNLGETRGYVSVGKTYTPNPENHSLYLHLFDIYQEVYRRVAGQFPEICEIQAASLPPETAGDERSESSSSTGR